MELPAAASGVVKRWIAAGAAPGAVAVAGGRWAGGNRSGGDEQAIAACGVRREGGPATTVDTRYDLASLTKVVATTPSILRLASEREISLDDEVGRFFSNAGWFQKPSLAQATVRQLLTHTSGMPAFLPLFAQVSERRTALAAVLQTPLEQPGRVVYSDLGFMLLGALVERVSGLRLDSFVHEHVLTPLGMQETGFGPISGVPIAATEDCGWRGRLLEGEVHDENATVWDGVAGHAGLFGTAGDLARFCRAWLDLDPRLGSEELLVEAQREGARGDDGSRRGLGWLLASEGSLGGRSASGFGHSGFTGTSLWIEPEERAFAVLLTNRVHPHRSLRKGIADLRVEYHDALRQGVA